MAKLLAIADRERHPDYPNVPLISRFYPDIAIVGWLVATGRPSRPR